MPVILGIVRWRSASVMFVFAAAAGLGGAGCGAGHGRTHGATRGTIAFFRYTRAPNRPPSAHLYLVGADGSRLRPVAPGGSGYPVWSPDGRRIAFATRDTHAALWIVNRDGTGLRRLTAPRGQDCSWLGWSPDGRKLDFTQNDGCEGDMAVFVVDADGTHLKRLTRARYGHSNPAWSPDGRSILYLSSPGGRLYLMDADGGNKRAIPGTHLEDPGGTPSMPPAVWSRDGKRIFYLDYQGALVVVRRDGSARRRVTRGTAFREFALSPDGTRVALAANEGYHRDIYVVRSDGSGLTRLTDGGIDGTPSWSPDGSRIAFESKSGVEVMNADGSDRIEIAKGGSAPAWAPVG
jgi:TolB protein